MNYELRITDIAGWFVEKIHEFSLLLQHDCAGQLQLWPTAFNN